MAEKSGVVAGLHSVQLALMSFVGSSRRVLGTCSRRIMGLAQAAMSESAPRELFKGNSMFDCPLASQTSPTRTLFNLIAPPSELVMVNVAGPPSLRFFNASTQTPFVTGAETTWP